MECISGLGQRLCKENRIDGIINVNRVWLIPKNAKILLMEDIINTKIIKNKVDSILFICEDFSAENH